MKILITGAAGFIGKNLFENLRLQREHTVFSYDIQDSEEALEGYLSQAELIYHLAGVNRPREEKEFAEGNIGFTGSILAYLKAHGKKTPIVLTSSIQAALSNPYGKSKRGAEEAVFAYGEETGAPVYVYRLPNAFGKWSRPNYNSVVSTFCYNAANGLPLRVDAPEKELHLVYIDDIVQEFSRVIGGKPTPSPTETGYYEVPVTYTITLGKLAETVQGFAASREDLIYRHNSNDPLMQKLYATFLTYLQEDAFSVNADMKGDARGFFAELIKSPYFGQISISRTKPGITRGNHWHNTKVEKFIVVEGQARIALRKLGSKDEVAYIVSGDQIQIVDIPPGYAHTITNVGQTDMLTVIWAGEMFDPANMDTMPVEAK